VAVGSGTGRQQGADHAATGQHDDVAAVLLAQGAHLIGRRRAGDPDQVVPRTVADRVRDDPTHVVRAAGAGHPPIEQECDVADDGALQLSHLWYLADRRLTTVDVVPAQHAPVDPRSASLVESADPDLEHEALFRRLSFTALDLSAQEADAVEFDQCQFERTTLAAAVLDQPRFTDCVVSHCDWANARLTKPALLRTRLASVRLTGAQCTAGTLRDVTFEDCRADLAAFRFTSFAHVRFTGCNLTGADFTGADLRRAEFISCDLTGAQFSNGNCTGARFTGCDLSGIGGVASLSGATITADDLIALSHTFARALGITVVAR
jgi:uncharacterized protein YjbI with pentapeptide repeats